MSDNSNPNHMSVGGEKERAGLGWSGRDDNWNQGAAKEAPATPAPTEGSETEPGGAELFVGFDEGDIANMRDQLARKLSTLEQLQRIYGLDDREVAELAGEAPVARAAGKTEPASTTASVEARLVEIRKLRHTDSKKYWSDEIQAKELRLLGERDAGKADAAHDAAIQGFLDTLRPGMEDAASMESGFDKLFPTLPSEDQDRIRQEVAFPTEPVQPASEKEIAAFAERPEGAALVKEWGRAAPQRVAAFQTRLKAMVRADTTGKLAAWFAGRSPEEARAIARALVRG